MPGNIYSAQLHPLHRSADRSYFHSNPTIRNRVSHYIAVEERMGEQARFSMATRYERRKLNRELTGP